MQKMKRFQSLIFAVLMCASSLHANEAELRAHLDAWKLEVGDWKQAYAAADAEKKKELIYKMPDEVIMTRQIWGLIGTKSVQEPWALPGIIWLLQHPTGIAKNFDKKQQPKLIQLLLDSVEKHHIKDPAIASLCPALCEANNAQCQRILELINKNNSSAQTKGVACLALALISKGAHGVSSDHPNINAERLKYLRQAVIAAYDHDFGGRTVGDIAADEIYEINNLSLRRKAPLFELSDTKGKSIKLPAPDINTLVLFWDARQTGDVDLMSSIHNVTKKYPSILVAPVLIGANEKTGAEILSHFEILGDTFLDPKGDTFQLYRIRQTPFVYLIDDQGVIQYRGIPDIVFQSKLTQFMEAKAKATPKPATATPVPQPTPTKPTTAPVATPEAVAPPPLREFPPL